jgi:hypothetical protein
MFRSRFEPVTSRDLVTCCFKALLLGRREVITVVLWSLEMSPLQSRVSRGRSVTPQAPLLPLSGNTKSTATLVL